MKFEVLTIALLFVLRIATQDNKEPTAYCFKDGEKFEMRFELKKNDDTISAIYGLNVDDLTSDFVNTCSTASGEQYGTAEITGTGDDNDPYTITVTIDVNGVIPSCGEKATGNLYEWAFRTAEIGLIQKPTDSIYSITCDYDNINDNRAGTATVSVSGYITQSVVKPVTESISLVLVDKDDFIITGPALGLGAKLQLQLGSIDEPNGATGIYAYNCDSGDSQNFNGLNHELTDGFGCTSTVLLDDGFTAADDSGSVIRSGLFELFQFTGSSTVFYRCRVGYCYTETDPKCQDYCEHNGETDLGRRKRRSAINNGTLTEETIVASYLITNSKHHIIAKTGQSNVWCQNNVGIAVGFSLLGSLVLLSTFTAIFLFIKHKLSIKSQKHNST